MTFAFKLLRIIGALCVATSLCACSAIKLGYNNLDDLAYWWLDGYVDFTDAQAPRVREDLKRLQQWHRTNELPKLAEVLARTEQLIAGTVTAEQACSVFGEARDRLDAAAQQAEPAVVALATSLDASQLRYLERKYAKNNTQYRKEWIEISAADQKEKRFDSVLERSEMIYGRLDEPQRAAMRKQIDTSMFDASKILAERQRRQQDILQTLRKVTAPGLSLADARTLMRGYFERVQNSPDSAYRSYQESLIKESCAGFAAAHATTTPAQREVAARRLRAYQRDVRELAAQK